MEYASNICEDTESLCNYQNMKHVGFESSDCLDAFFSQANIHMISNKITELLFGVVPQVMPTITSYWLYRFEINLRASAVLGVVGAGGVGAELINQLRFRDFPRAGTVLVVTILMVLIVDTISAAIRRRIIKGREIKV